MRKTNIHTYKKQNPNGLKLRQKTCFVTREQCLEKTLIRCVRDSQNQIIADLGRKLPGRGAWIKADRETIDKAINNNLFSKAFKCQVRIDPSFTDQLENLLEKNCLSLLGLAFRSGSLYCGFESVKKQIQVYPPAFLIFAKNASKNAKKNLEEWRNKIQTPYTIIDRFSSEQLGGCLGVGDCVYAFFKQGQLADRFHIDWKKLIGLEQK